MLPERWTQIKGLLDRLFDLPPERRAALLQEECGDDEALRKEVQSLLEAYEEGNTFLDEGARGSLLFDEVTSMEAQQIGPYRIVGLIEHGGMGAVYRAVRADDQYEREVALKVIRPGFDTDDLVRRFLAERQILAGLEHAHIARLYDGGLTADGRPYFVMEHVEGTPIVEYCDLHCLSVQARLRLFVRVAQAVAYAHRKLVVHRDLKPSNILVTEEGEPKLLDFGIAKLLDDEQARRVGSPMTRTGLHMMTPQYAAPEQVRGEPVSTATDIYALGVILYELLTGRRPYRFEKRSPGAVERVICEEQPERPSTAVGRTQQGTDEATNPDVLSRRRAARPTQLRRILMGDLDTIVLKALRKEPERRYASAEQLTEDIERYLAGRPVTARPDTLAYRTRTFIRRNRWSVAASTAMLLLLIAYTITVTVQANRISHERDRAQTEAEKAERVSAFLIDLFEAADPEGAGGETVTARQLLERGAEEVSVQLEEHPEVQAEMMEILGKIHRRLGNYDTARVLLEMAVSQQLSLYGNAHPEVAEGLSELALYVRDQGEYETAEAFLREAIAVQRRAFGEESAEVATGLKNLSYVLRVQGKHEEARRAIVEALEIQRGLYEDEHLAIAESLFNLAAILRDQDNLDEAEAIQRESLAMVRALTEGPHPGVAANLNHLALLLKRKGQLAEAEGLYREALAMNRQLYRKDHPEVATLMGNLAIVLQEQGRYEEAERLHEGALSMRRALYGEAHPHIALSLHRLGAFHLERGTYATADSLFRDALAMRRTLFGDDHPATRATQQSLRQLNDDRQQPEPSDAPRAQHTAETME